MVKIERFFAAVAAAPFSEQKTKKRERSADKTKVGKGLSQEVMGREWIPEIKFLEKGLPV